MTERGSWVAPVLVSVTALGSRHGTSSTAADQVVAYLEGEQVTELGHDSAVAVGPERYFADSTQEGGRWIGEGSTLR